MTCELLCFRNLKVNVHCQKKLLMLIVAGRVVSPIRKMLGHLSPHGSFRAYLLAIRSHPCFIDGNSNESFNESFHFIDKLMILFSQVDVQVKNKLILTGLGSAHAAHISQFST